VQVARQTAVEREEEQKNASPHPEDYKYRLRTGEALHHRALGQPVRKRRQATKRQLEKQNLYHRWCHVAVPDLCETAKSLLFR